MIRGLIAGRVLTLVVLVAGAYVFVRAGALPANADARPGRLETWAAKTSLRATIAREAPKGDNPVAASPGNLQSGMKLFLANCAVCHGAGDGKATNVAAGLYQKPPQFTDDGVEDDPPGITFWKAKHGIRFTGMPAFARTLSDTQLWQVTAFLQNMDKLPSPLDAQWKRARVSEALAPASLMRRGRRPPRPQGS